MPIRHCVQVFCRPDTDRSSLESMAAALRSLPSQIPEIDDYEVGIDLGLTDPTPRVGIVARFASVEDWRTYVAHPAHQSVIRDHIDPVSDQRSSVQFELP